MQFRIFSVPVTDNGSIVEEMNRFLRAHKVLEVDIAVNSSK